MSYDYRAPCRAHIIADGKSVVIPYTGYGGQRHIDRWRKRGAKKIVVMLTSHSTGRVCTSLRWGAA